MITINLDKKNNRIIVAASGTVSKEEISAKLNEFLKLSAALDDGFDVINDLSQLDAEPEVLLTLNKIHLKMKELFRIGKVIRVIGQSKTLLLELSGLDNKLDISHIHYVSTLEAAIDFIENG